jgi:hypothetical protein
MKIIKHEGAWHIAQSTAVDGDTGYSFTSWCGITAPWDNTFVDQMPSGGTAGACQKCRVLCPAVDTPEPIKGTRKSKR